MYKCKLIDKDNQASVWESKSFPTGGFENINGEYIKTENDPRCITDKELLKLTEKTKEKEKENKSNNTTGVVDTRPFCDSIIKDSKQNTDKNQRIFQCVIQRTISEIEKSIGYVKMMMHNKDHRTFFNVRMTEAAKIHDAIDISRTIHHITVNSKSKELQVSYDYDASGIPDQVFLNAIKDDKSETQEQNNSQSNGDACST